MQFREYKENHLSGIELPSIVSDIEYQRVNTSDPLENLDENGISTIQVPVVNQNSCCSSCWYFIVAHTCFFTYLNVFVLSLYLILLIMWKIQKKDAVEQQRYERAMTYFPAILLLDIILCVIGLPCYRIVAAQFRQRALLTCCAFSISTLLSCTLGVMLLFAIAALGAMH